MSLDEGPPLGGVPLSSSSSSRVSYASALNKNLYLPKPNIAEKEVMLTTNGDPIIIFTPQEIAKSAEPFRFSLVAKCAYGRPSIADTKEILKQHFGITTDFVISVLDRRHLLLRFHCPDDFQKVWLKDFMYVKGFLFRFFKWSADFNPDFEPTIIPAWVDIPGLQPNFYHPDLLQSVVKPLGSLLKVDLNTLHCTKTDMARVCVEIDIDKKLPDKLRIGVADEKGMISITILDYHFEKKIKYCKNCLKHGHLASGCKFNKDGNNGKDTVGNTSKRTIVEMKTGESKEKRWRPKEVGKEDMNLEKPAETNNAHTTTHSFGKNDIYDVSMNELVSRQMAAPVNPAGHKDDVYNEEERILEGRPDNSVKVVDQSNSTTPLLTLVHSSEEPGPNEDDNDEDNAPSEDYDEEFLEDNGRLISMGSKDDGYQKIKAQHHISFDKASEVDACGEFTNGLGYLGTCGTIKDVGSMEQHEEKIENFGEDSEHYDEEFMQVGNTLAPLSKDSNLLSGLGKEKEVHISIDSPESVVEVSDSKTIEEVNKSNVEQIEELVAFGKSLNARMDGFFARVAARNAIRKECPKPMQSSQEVKGTHAIEPEVDHVLTTASDGGVAGDSTMVAQNDDGFTLVTRRKKSAKSRDKIVTRSTTCQGSHKGHHCPFC